MSDEGYQPKCSKCGMRISFLNADDASGKTHGYLCWRCFQSEYPANPVESDNKSVAFRWWRFLHMLSHIPLGFGEPLWAMSFHDWTASMWERSK